jgi:hypothetical protein
LPEKTLYDPLEPKSETSIKFLTLGGVLQ